MEILKKANHIMKSVGTLDEKADDIINFYFYFYKVQYAAYVKSMMKPSAFTKLQNNA
ncbi:hypothetical protein ACEQPO_18650 [Bacillus sp. SL00103]